MRVAIQWAVLIDDVLDGDREKHQRIHFRDDHLLRSHRKVFALVRSTSVPRVQTRPHVRLNHLSIANVRHAKHELELTVATRHARGVRDEHGARPMFGISDSREDQPEAQRVDENPDE